MKFSELSASKKKIFLQFVACLFAGLGLIVLMSSSIEGIAGMVVLGFFMSWLNMMYFLFQIKAKNLEAEKDPEE